MKQRLHWKSPDHQTDGLGSGISSLSKVCIVNRSKRDDADVDYTFAGIGIEGNEVDYAGNCGNMSASIGPYTFDKRMLGDIDYDSTREFMVRIFNTNTKKIIHSTFPVANGHTVARGNFAIDGVAGTGAKVRLDFLHPGGSKTGKLLPTEAATNTFSGIEASCVDAAGPFVFVRASDVGVDGAILPNDFNKRTQVLELLEQIRREAAVRMGMARSVAAVPRVTPKIAIVSPPTDYHTLSGQLIASSSVNVVVRFLSDTQPHRAIPVTGALGTAVAAKIPGTVVHQALPAGGLNGDIQIGHPSGRIQVNATMNSQGGVESATLFRTARLIMDGKVWWHRSEGIHEQPEPTTEV